MYKYIVCIQILTCCHFKNAFWLVSSWTARGQRCTKKYCSNCFIRTGATETNGVNTSGFSSGTRSFYGQQTPSSWCQRTTYDQALSMKAPRPPPSAPHTKFGKQPLSPLADTPIQETKLLHNFLTLCTDFALIHSLFYLSLLWWETEKATSMALFVCAPQGKLTETFIMLLYNEHFWPIR